MAIVQLDATNIRSDEVVMLSRWAGEATSRGGRVVAPVRFTPSAPSVDPLFINHPLGGDRVSVADIDGLIDLYEEADNLDKSLYACKCEIRAALAKLTEGDAKTRRVQGKRRRAKVEMPDVKFDQSVLKALWESHPQFARDYMGIASINVRMREYKKLANTSSSDDAFTYFRNAMTRADQGATGLATVKVEK